MQNYKEVKNERQSIFSSVYWIKCSYSRGMRSDLVLAVEEALQLSELSLTQQQSEALRLLVRASI